MTHSSHYHTLVLCTLLTLIPLPTQVNLEIRTIDDETLVTLSDLTTAEKSTSKTAKDIMELRKKVGGAELWLAGWSLIVSTQLLTFSPCGVEPWLACC